MRTHNKKTAKELILDSDIAIAGLDDEYRIFAPIDSRMFILERSGRREVALLDSQRTTIAYLDLDSTSNAMLEELERQIDEKNGLYHELIGNDQH